MSDVIHLDPTGAGGGAGATLEAARAQTKVDVENPERLTACGLKLAEVQNVGFSKVQNVTCPKCRAATGS